jgi:alcohol dehydrogenase YqhD (iron-dependent ADH family)
MENFEAWNPVHLHFGRGVTSKLPDILPQIGRKALLLIGKGSVKQNGIYNIVAGAINASGIEMIEFEGIKPNPLLSDVRKAVALGIARKVDMVIGLGGGSVIDSAKAIAVSIPGHLDPWDIFKRVVKPERALPVVSVLTLAATGTEMNQFSVIQNEETLEKIGFGHPLMYPVHSFLDPSFTITVNRDYTVYGITDLIAHSLESYFGEGEADLSDRFVFSIVAEAMEFAPHLLADLASYELRARMMWAATTALNGLTGYGRRRGDWTVHALGHSISMLFDTPHGATLSIVYPAWLKYLSSHIPNRISKLGTALFNDGSVDGTIEKITGFFQSIGSPVTLAEAGIIGNDRQKLLEHWVRVQAQGNIYRLGSVDYNFLLTHM